jgi:translation initiation factor 2 alpha subunit (eIF-2alpha)
MMTPKEASRYCAETEGYGLGPNIVKAIQKDALEELNGFLNKLLVPTIKIEHRLLIEFESPMTIVERVKWALTHADSIKPDKNVKVPTFDVLSDGCDPKLAEKIHKEMIDSK